MVLVTAYACETPGAAGARRVSNAGWPERVESASRATSKGSRGDSSGHYENRWSEVHPEANLRDHYRSTAALCQQRKWHASKLAGETLA